MKTIFSVLTMLLIVSTALSQSPTVTIKSESNRNRQILVDNRSYSVASGTDNTITISNLSPGQHSLAFVRPNQSTRTTTYFTVRDGYDLAITINQNGSVSTSETRVGRATGNAITTNAFNRLLTQTRNKTGATARANFLETEFNRGNRRFTSGQATQLIKLVNSESLRLKLAKQSYQRISDIENFHLVFELLNSTASKNSLNDYLVSLQNTNQANEVAMTSSQFATIYNEVVAERTNSDRVYYLSNLFDRGTRYYTSSQARQLIQAVSGEQDRLDLAKKAYRGVVDKNDYYNTISSLLQYTSGKSELLAYINSNPTTEDTRTAMSESDFNRIYSAVRTNFSSSGKFNLVNSAFNTTSNYFSTSQVRQLLLQISAEADRVSLAKNAYDNIVDLSNYSNLYAVIPSTNGKNELAAFVSARQGLATAKVAMADSEFNSLYRDVQLTFGIGAKNRSLTEIFNSQNNYFSVTQARQLIQLVSSESNRLELAKLAYDNITDPDNFSVIYDLLSSQSSKNELRNYVESSASRWEMP